MTLDRRLVVDALPNYEIGEEIGRGGWGVVLSGRHRELGRNVAIKQLPRAFAADPSVRSRFKDEARLIASLDHPHIVPVYDFVESEGLCLIVMELMPGGTLWDRFTGPGLPVDQACGLMLCASAALHMAHGRGILHRDVKPENFLFSATGIMKLGDFGIAKLLDASQAGHTLTGQIIGTPAYMAPEQASGEALGPYTDVYSCAVMLYELLTGELPFVETREPLGQLMQRLTQPPRPIATTRPDVPRDIGLTVMQALERDPANRFPSAGAFGESLARSATIAFGPGWLLRSGIEVLGAQGLVAITSMPVIGSGDDELLAKKTVRPTMTHARVDDVVVVEPPTSEPHDELEVTAASPAAMPSQPPPSVGVATPSKSPSVEPPTAPPAESFPVTGDPNLTVAPQSHWVAPSPPPETPPGSSPPPPVPPLGLEPPPPPAVAPYEPPATAYEQAASGAPAATAPAGPLADASEAHQEPPNFTMPPQAAFPSAAAPDPHAATIGAPPTVESIPGAGRTPEAPGYAAPQPHQSPQPTKRSSARTTGAVVITVLLVLALFAGGAFLLVKAKSGGTGGDASTTLSGSGGGALRIESVKPSADGNAQVVTWSSGNGGPHYLYAVGDNFSNLVVADQSPTTVSLPASGKFCFVLADQNLSNRSEPSCGNGGTPELVPTDLR